MQTQGEKKFGLAFLDASDERASHCITVSSVDDAVKEVEKRGEPLGLGIDAPMWWTSRGKGFRINQSKARSAIGLLRYATSGQKILAKDIVLNSPDR